MAKTAQLTKCQCHDDCQAETRSFFAQGHDAAMVSRLRNEVVAGRPAQDAVKELYKRGGGDALRIKLDTAIANAQAKAEKRANKKARKQSGVDKAIAKLDEQRGSDGIVEAMTPANGTRIGDQVTVKIGRWTYDAEIVRDASGELAARYENKQGIGHTVGLDKIVK